MTARPRIRHMLIAILACGALIAPSPAQAGTSGTIDTLAGGGVGDGRMGTEAHVTGILSIGVDGSGNVYWTENNHLVGGQRARMWGADTGRVRTIAGTGLQKGVFDGDHGDGGPAAKAVLHNPFGIDADSRGNVYIHDTGNGRLRRVDAATGVITKVADAGSFGGTAVEVDRKDRVLFTSGDTIQRYDPATGQVTRIAGGGSLDLDEQQATSVRISSPADIEVDDGGNVYFSEGSRIRWIDTQGYIHAIVGGRLGHFSDDGQYGFLTRYQGIGPILLRSDGSLWYLEPSRIRRVSGTQEFFHLPGSRRVTTVMPVPGGYADGPLAEAGFTVANWAQYPGGGFVVGDYGNRRIRLVQNDVMTTIVGNGLSQFYNSPEPDIYDWTGDGLPAVQAFIDSPTSVAIGADGDVFVTDTNFHSRVRRIDAATGIISTAAGTEAEGYEGDGGPATEAVLNRPGGVLVAPDGDLYIAEGRNHAVRRVEADTGVITTIAGTGEEGSSGDGGPATEARLYTPLGLAMDPAGNLYISDPGDHRVRRVTPQGVIFTVAGSGQRGFSGDGGHAGVARLDGPRGIALLLDGSLVIADSGNNRIRKVAPNGIITTIAGTGAAGYYGDGGPWPEAEFYFPNGLAVDSATGTIFVSDTYNQVVRRLDPDGKVRHVTGDGTLEFCGDGGPAEDACVRNPHGLAVTPAGDLLIADYSNLRVRIVHGVV